MTDRGEVQSNRPTLTEWMKGASARHPLHELRDDPLPDAAEILDRFDELLATVELAAPARWQGKRRDFRRVTTEQQLLELRGEFVIAAKLARSGTSFDFGTPGISNPDLILRDAEVGVEVTGKTPEGVQHLYEEIDVMLRNLPGCAVTLWFSDYPVRIRAGERRDLLERVRAIAENVATVRHGGVAELRVEDPRNGSSIAIQATVLPVPRLARGLRVTWETDGGPLGPALAAVEREVLSVLDNPQKRRQADSMPTLLAVDIARLGAGWMRPPKVWASALAEAIPHDCPFVGLAVFMNALDRVDGEMALAASPAATAEDRDRLRYLGRGLGLEVAG